MFDMIKPYLLVAVVVVIAGLFASTLYYSHEAETFEKSASALQSKVDEYVAQDEANKASAAQVSKENAVTGQKFLDAKRSVEGFKGREHILRAKPTLTEKMINKSFGQFADEISCTTGDIAPCK